MFVGFFNATAESWKNLVNTVDFFFHHFLYVRIEVRELLSNKSRFFGQLKVDISFAIVI